VLAQKLDHFRLDIIGVYLTVGADTFGHAPGHIAGARSDIGHSGAFGNADGVQRGVGLLLGFAFGSHQPIGAARTHDPGIFPPADWMDAGLNALRPRERGGKNQQNADAPARTFNRWSHISQSLLSLMGSISVGKSFKPSSARCMAGRTTPRVSNIFFAPA